MHEFGSFQCLVELLEMVMPMKDKYSVVGTDGKETARYGVQFLLFEVAVQNWVGVLADHRNGTLTVVRQRPTLSREVDQADKMIKVCIMMYFHNMR